jgi:hypothetical protein
MSTPTNILGKIGQSVGEEIKALRVSLGGQISNINLNSITGGLAVTKDSGTGIGISTNGKGVFNSIEVSLGSVLKGAVQANSSITALGAISGLRAEIAEDLAVGTDATITGELDVVGKITAGSLEVTGETKVINTTSVEVSDNIIELNKSDDGSTTATISGIEINRGETTGSTTTIPRATGAGTIRFNPKETQGVASGLVYGDESFALTIQDADLYVSNDEIYTFSWDSSETAWVALESDGTKAFKVAFDYNMTIVGAQQIPMSGWFLYKWDSANWEARPYLVSAGETAYETYIQIVKATDINVGDIFPLTSYDLSGVDTQRVDTVDASGFQVSTNVFAYTGSVAGVDVGNTYLNMSADGGVAQNATAGEHAYPKFYDGAVQTTENINIVSGGNEVSLWGSDVVNVYHYDLATTSLNDWQQSDFIADINANLDWNLNQSTLESSPLYSGRANGGGRAVVIIGDIAPITNSVSDSSAWSLSSNDSLIIGLYDGNKTELDVHLFYIDQDLGLQGKSLFKINTIFNYASLSENHSWSLGSQGITYSSEANGAGNSFNGDVIPTFSTNLMSPLGSFNYTSPQPSSTNTTSGSTATKSKILWDNSNDQQRFKLLLGDENADLIIKDLDASVVNVPDGNGLKIGVAPIGTYADFTNALDQAKA